MKVKRYVARTSREALRQIKDELGNDAVILSNRKTRDGVEIMALAEAEMSNLVQPQITQVIKDKIAIAIQRLQQHYMQKHHHFNRMMSQSLRLKHHQIWYPLFLHKVSSRKYKR